MARRNDLHLLAGVAALDRAEKLTDVVDREGELAAATAEGQPVQGAAGPGTAPI